MKYERDEEKDKITKVEIKENSPEIEYKPVVSGDKTGILPNVSAFDHRIPASPDKYQYTDVNVGIGGLLISPDRDRCGNLLQTPNRIFGGRNTLSNSNTPNIPFELKMDSNSPFPENSK
jgi:hypothetical protein